MSTSDLLPPLAILVRDTPQPSRASWFETSEDEAKLPPAGDVGLLALVELVLKNPAGLHRLLRDTTGQTSLLWRLLTISVLSFVLFGGAMSLVLSATGHWPELANIPAWLARKTPQLVTFHALDLGWGRLAPWIQGGALQLTAAYALGLVAATGVCLPSLYFYCLLSGIRLKMVDVVLHAVKAKAVAAVALVGILPLYVAVAMGAAVFGAPRLTLESTLLLGLALPFLAGLWGTQSLYQGFAQVAARCQHQPESRQCFLRRLVLSWSACYAVVVPVMVYSLWEVFARL